jgi:hypothetical protein
MADQPDKKEGVLKRFTKATREFIYGMTAYETVRFALETRSSIEHVFLLIIMSDLMGIPILRSYYSLRILPYVIPKLESWKYRTLREKDITDALSQG